jgi:ribonuclease M5
MNKIPVKQIVIVEGKYDKITLENIIDATIIACDGFGIFKNEEQKTALQEMAKQNGAIILTDSDSAGGLLRSYLQTILQNASVYTLYIPAIPGKEKRKTSFSKEGYLGVEGTDPAVLRCLFEEFRAEAIPTVIQARDLFEYGLTGTTGSAARKAKLLRALNLPPHLSNKALLKELNRRFEPIALQKFIFDLFN